MTHRCVTDDAGSQVVLRAAETSDNRQYQLNLEHILTTPARPTLNATIAPVGTAEAVPDKTFVGDFHNTDGPSFAELGVRAETVESLASMGITHPFAIQALSLPIALPGNDVIGQARTGTGKTLAFGIPMLERVTGPDDEANDGLPQGLVIVPTRELCIQVANDLERAGRKLGVRVQAIYGGRAYEPQVEALARGIEIVVGTPGRLIDLAQQRSLILSSVNMLVLDEADEMLDLGFLPDVERILAMTPSEGRQTMLFSATMPGPIVALARRFMSQPTHVRAEMPDEGRTVPTTRQFVYRAHAMDKAELLARVLQADGRGLTMVFCRTKRTCDKLAAELTDRGFAAAAVHGDLGQGAREQALRAFRAGKVDVLIATDVAARGIDVTGVTHVINYQCPEEEKTYLHRIGRTGRAGESGTAITLVDWDDIPRWQLINKALDLPFPDPAETYSSSKHLREDLGIPEGVTGVLPRASRTRAGLEAEDVEDIGGRAPKGSRGGGRSREGRSGGGGRTTGGQRSGGGSSDGASRESRSEGSSDGAARQPRERRPRQRTRGGKPSSEA